jgi:CBS domain-containing protein
MADTSLQIRIADFLKTHPPFIHFSEEDLLLVSKSIIVIYYAKDEYVYKSNQEHGENIYVIRQGAVRKWLLQYDHLKLVDTVDEGDVFGVSALISQSPYKTSAQAMEDTMIYAIPWKIFLPFMEKYSKVALYFAAGYAQNLPFIRFNVDEVSDNKSDFVTDMRNPLFQEDDIIPVNIDKPVVSCPVDATIKEAAELLSRENVGSTIVVDDEGKPLGIVTDVDFRLKAVAQAFPINRPVAEIMSQPVYTVKEGMTAGEVILIMTQNKIRHLCVTRDGTRNSEAIAVISEHDILLLHGNNPAIIVKEIMNNRDRTALSPLRDRADVLAGQYLRQGASVSFVARILGGINDAIHIKAVEFAMSSLKERGLERPDVSFCWCTLGSQGRSEQMLKTDQDNAIIFDDVDGQVADSTLYYFVSLGREINNILNECGFSYCSSNMMGGNSRWCQPLSSWKKYFSKWIQVPEEKSLMNGNIFFDFRPVYGDFSLAERLWDHINGELSREKAFVNFLAANAKKNPPPLSFFKNIILEKSGEHKSKLDLKHRGTMPLADAARVLALDFRVAHITNTVDRFKEVVKKDPGLEEIVSLAVHSYELFLRFRTLNGLQNDTDGRYLDPSKLTKIEKNALKNAFRTIEMIQEILTVRYQLDYIR